MSQPVQSKSSDPLKDATINAFSRLIDPLLNLMLDTGVTVRELNQITRERSVFIASRRIARETGRNSKSRVAILTGLPRSEVARLLTAKGILQIPHRGQHPVRRVLSAWFEDTMFLTTDGEPAVLPIFGKRKSLEKLVNKYSGGVPVRAMLDELLRTDAVEWLGDQKIKPRRRLPMSTGLTVSSIAMMGERGRDLLETLTKNAHITANPLFEATAVVSDADPDMTSIARREIAIQGTSFIDGVDRLLSRMKRNAVRASSKPKMAGRRIGVTVYYFQEDTDSASESPIIRNQGRRKNLRRAKNGLRRPGNRT
jgi:hypothetical protein